MKIRVKADGSGVETANVKMNMNLFDEIAVEGAVRCKEAGKATEIVVVSVGPAQAQETLRTALAMGADRAILVQTDVTTEPLAVAKVLKALVEKEAPGLVDGAVFVDEGDHFLNGRSSSAWAKYADALRRISFAWRSSRTSRSSALIRSCSSVVGPERLP